MTRVTLVLKTNEGGLWVVPQLLALRAAGATVTAIIPAGDGRLRRALEQEQLPVLESPFDFSFRPSLRTISGLSRLRRSIRATKPDVVFYHLYASALAARLSTLGLRLRRVHMVAGPLYLESRGIRAAERLLMRLDDHLIGGSEYTARLYTDIGMPKSKVSAIPYGVDLHAFSKDRVADQPVELTNTSASDGEPALRVVMVAYVYAPKSAVFPGVGIKGHDVLLQAWKIFSADHPRASLVLVGSGFDEAGERHRRLLLEQFHVDEDSTIKWFEKVDDVRPYYAASDLSVSPSLSENHGAALEASAMGLPSIVSDAGALPETVTRGSGWVVRAGDVDSLVGALKLAWSAQARGELAPMGLAAREFMMEQFGVQVCASQVVEKVLG